MPNSDSATVGNITRLLHSYGQGSRASLDELIPIVYRELKSIAHAQLKRSGMQTRMQTTMLVHEAYEKLARGQTQQASDRRHFFAIASRAMRQIVVDSYRASGAAKRGGNTVPEPLVTNQMIDMESPDRVMQLDQAVQRLSSENEELAELVDLSCFGGLSTAEIAALTDENVRTVQRKLARAEAWVGTFLGDARD